MKNILLLFFLFTIPVICRAQTIIEKCFPNEIYSQSIPSPCQFLGFEIGDRPIRYDEAARYFKLLADKADNVQFIQKGETYEGRKLFYLVITSKENYPELEQIKHNIGKLSDPRNIGPGSEAENIIQHSPAVAMMLFSIHGNETSGTDAAVLLAYQLAAGNDAATLQILNNLVVCIYPMENPDGRERFNNQLLSWSGNIKNSDVQSMPHSGVWPSGRTNHYYFDLNRDWFILSQPESRARVKALVEWNPQLVVDAHEMGSFSTFLFNPPREPINPNLPKRIINWWGSFASDQAEAFDKNGWSYYTREWLEEWYPGYGTSWPSYRGAVSILYEQARTSGIKVKRPDGTTLTFKNAIEHQFISSLANLTTASGQREKLLREFYKIKRDAVTSSRKDGIKTFIIENSNNTSRVNRLIETLTFQGLEVYQSQKGFSLSQVKSYWNNKPIEKKFPDGTFIIPVKQPSQYLLNAVLEFDTRMNNKFLKSERESLEKGKGTRLYEVSAWSMLLAYGVEAYTSKSEPEVEKKLIKNLPRKTGKVFNIKPRYGYLINYEDDNSVNTLLKLLDHGFKVYMSVKKLTVENRNYKLGTILLRNNDNPDSLEAYLQKVAEETGINVFGVNTALSESGTDLGGSNFKLLYKPKTALLTGGSIDMNNFGAVWYMFDRQLGLRTSILKAENINRYDLRKYNVIVLPSVYGGFKALKKMLTQGGLNKIKKWIFNGGTFIALDQSSAAIADSSLKFTKVKIRRQALNLLDDYHSALKYERNSTVNIDSVEIWESKESIAKECSVKPKSKQEIKALAKKDKEQIKFMPRGAILKVKLDKENWLNFGVGTYAAALLYSNYTLLAKRPVKTAAWFDDYNNIRLSGLMWREARARLQNTAYCTREAYGNGQIILFANQPNFRSYFYSTAKIFINAVLLGPGFGTNQVVEW